ncbi:hypothetical protein CR513_61753, partial [Mucuna pruriens]
METLRRSSRLLCLILAMSIVGLRCDHLKIGNASIPSPSEANATFVTLPSLGINQQVNNKVNVKNSWYYGGGGGGGGGGGVRKFVKFVVTVPLPSQSENRFLNSRNVYEK